MLILKYNKHAAIHITRDNHALRKGYIKRGECLRNHFRAHWRRMEVLSRATVLVVACMCAYVQSEYASSKQCSVSGSRLRSQLVCMSNAYILEVHTANENAHAQYCFHLHF